MITLKGGVVSAGASKGTPIGLLQSTLGIPEHFVLFSSGGLPLKISAGALVSAWSGLVTARCYAVIVVAFGGEIVFDFGHFVVEVLPAPRLAGDPASVFEQLLKEA